MGGGACLISGLDCPTSGLDWLMSDLGRLISDNDCLISGLDCLISGRDYLISAGGGNAEAKAWEEVPAFSDSSPFLQNELFAFSGACLSLRISM